MPPFFDLHGDPTMDPYTILSLPPTASEAEIKKAYRMQMLQLHPDKLSPSLSENSIAAVTDKFHNVKDAYEFLMSPIHLTSRRLYMAKMASRRAEYERREAYIRRNGGVGAASQYTSNVSGYASGGGGAAGMAGTGMRNNANPSYGVPPSTNKNMKRSKSEPVFEAGGKTNRGRKSTGGHNGVGEPRYYKNTGGQNDRGRSGGNHCRHQSSPSSVNKNKGHRDNGRNGGYKSDSHAMPNKSKSNREGRTRSKPKSSKHTSNTLGREKEKQRRSKSQPQRRDKNNNQHSESSEGEKGQERIYENKKRTSAKNRKSRDGEQQQHPREQEDYNRKRRRAKSAPAASRNNGYSKNLKYDKNNPSSLPKEFFCPLTKRLMKDPIKDSEGNTYEREAIERWLRVQSSSPITNGHLSLEMLRPDRELKRAIYKATGRPRSKSQTRSKTRSSSPTQELVSGRVLIDSYLREISSKSKLSVSLDGMGICAFSYRRITFVIEVPITPHAGFMVYSSFDGAAKNKYQLSEKMDAWNKWLSNVKRYSSVSYVKVGQKTVFTLKGSERDMSKCDVFQKTLEFFVEMSLKLHNLLHPYEAKVVENVCLTRAPVAVA